LFFLSQKKILNRRSMQAADKDQSARGYIRSEGDLFLNDAKQHAADASEPADAAGDDDPWDFQVQDSYQFCSVQPASMALKLLLQCCTGWQPVPLPADVSLTENAVGPADDTA
jgi:pectate lyase